VILVDDANHILFVDLQEVVAAELRAFLAGKA
jgi:hypothetical protein